MKISHLTKDEWKMEKSKSRSYWIIHKSFDASNICIVKAAMGRQFVHRAKGAQQRRQSVQLDEALDERMGLRP